jgi:PBSX family phage terminase large subunit
MANTTRVKAKTTGKIHQHFYEPWGGCKEVFDSREPEVLISGPAGTGKSRACLEKLHLICLMTPNVRALIIRKTLSSLGSTALVTWRNFVVKEAMATGTTVYYGGSKEEPAQYRYKNGSSVVIGGLDKSTRLMSSEYDIIYVQEATELTLDDLEMLKTRLRNWQISFQQLLMDCNPAGDKHWLKIRADDGVTKLIKSRHEDNPRLFTKDGELTEKGDKYINGILEKLTGVRYKRLRLGLWVSAEGIIYEEFDPTEHVLSWEFDDENNRLPLPLEWTRYWSIDFGFTNPFVLKCYAEGPDGELYMYREIYMTQRTVEEHAQTILDIVAPYRTRHWYDHFNRKWQHATERLWMEPQPTVIICDWDAEGRRTFERATGLGTQNAIKNVYEGINAVKERIKRNRLFYMEDSLVELDQSLRDKLLPTASREEFGSYVWKVNMDGRVQDQPVKRDDHGMDTDRYMVEYLDLKGMARATQV